MKSYKTLLLMKGRSIAMLARRPTLIITFNNSVGKQCEDVILRWIRRRLDKINVLFLKRKGDGSVLRRQGESEDYHNNC